MQPLEARPGELPVLDGNAPHHRADRRALDEGGHRRAGGEAEVPDPAYALAAVAELEGDAAEDQTDQQEKHRQVEGAEKDRIDRRERREEGGADHNEPGFVAIPKGRDRRHHRAALRSVPRHSEEDADAEVEAVEQHVDEDRDGDDPGPEMREAEDLHRPNSRP